MFLHAINYMVSYNFGKKGLQKICICPLSKRWGTMYM